MSRTVADIKVQLAALGEMDKLGRGGQGTAFRLKELPPIPEASGQYVFKKYHKKVLAASAVQLESAAPQLILFPDKLSAAEKRFLSTFTVWPHALVMDGDTAAGLLMKLIPDRYFFDLHLAGTGTTSRQLLEVRYLLTAEKTKRDYGIPEIKGKERVYLVRKILDTLAFLHDHEVVVGDFSARNIVVTRPDENATANAPNFLPKFLDSDGFRFTSGVPPIAQASTPGWITPESFEADKRAKSLKAKGAPSYEVERAENEASVQNFKSDVFKAGLLIMRLFHFTSDAAEDDTQTVYVSDVAKANLTKILGSQRAAVILSTLDTVPGNRPSIKDVRAVVPGL